MADNQHSDSMSSDSISEAERERRLRALMSTYQRPLMRYAIKLATGDRGFAEDVVQEAFVRAWTHIEQLTADRGSVLGWLRRVVHNLVMDGYRRRSTRPSEVGIEHAELVLVPDPTPHVDDSVVVDQVLGHLWSKHRAALVAVYLNDRSAADLAAELDVPVGTIKSRVHNAVKAARTVFADGPVLAG